jgi:UDP-GlcNAc:undecaprenyl-phosphate/decaprenyl-phosphate GlcNAc-1-phosphate transferase
MSSFHLFLIISFFSSVAISFGLNHYFLTRPMKFFIKKANKSAIRWSTQSKPIFGGITFFAVFLLGYVAYMLLIDNTIILNTKTIALLLTVTISFLMGFADDIMNTPPFFKFIIQVLNAIILISFDVYIVISPYPILNYIITTIWVVGIMNSINMLDNMDSITNLTSLSIIGGLLMALLFTNSNNSFFIFLLTVIIASMLSFLYYNWNPSKMYMGDNGSQFLGAILAFIGIVYFWNALPLEATSFGINTKQAIIVLLAFIVPISDTSTVTINRLMRGQSPFVGGKDHTTHHLSYAGLTDRGVALTLVIINSVCVGISLHLIYRLSNWNSTWFWLLFALAFIIFVSLYSLTKITKPK